MRPALPLLVFYEASHTAVHCYTATLYNLITYCRAILGLAHKDSLISHPYKIHQPATMFSAIADLINRIYGLLTSFLGLSNNQIIAMIDQKNLQGDVW